MKRARRCFIGLLGVGLLIGCGSRSNTADSSDVAKRSTQQRLQGRWVLVEFRPEEQLEPMLAALLAAQFNTLTVTVGPAHLHAIGAGVDTQRRYQLQWATGDQAGLKVLDESGISYDVAMTFERDGTLSFSSRTSPWRGVGRLRRVQ
jgi:hypothetical protein